MKIIVQNFEYGTGFRGRLREYLASPQHFLMAPEKPLHNFTRLVHHYDPDIVAIAELDLGSIRTHGHRQVEALQALGYRTVIAGEKYEPRGLAAHLPILRKQGNGLFMKTPPLEYHLRYFSAGVKRLYIETILPDHTHLFLVHLALSRHARRKQLDELALRISARKTVIVGDFNTIDAPEDLLEFASALKLRSANSRGAKTFPSYKPRMELDYALFSHSLTLKNFSVLHSHVADHLPIFLELE